MVWRTILIATLTLFIFSSPARGQASLKIHGKIIDIKTGEALTGASVVVEETRSGTVADLDGKFEITIPQKNSVRLIVSFIGYQTKQVDYNRKETGLPLLIKLEPVSTKLEQVEIKGEAKGQVKARLEQRTAINIKNVVSYEQIEKFPDLNAAEVMQRIPGVTLQRDQGEGRYVQIRGTPVEYTNFNINGEQIPSPEGGARYVGLDIISADQIEYLEISKVLTPDMDADGIGGNVNIITKTATSEKPEMNVSLAGGYNNLSEEGNYQGNFSYGQKGEKFGFLMNASYYLNNQASHNMEFKFDKLPLRNTHSQKEGQDNYHLVHSEFQLRHYDITRERIGLSATLDHDLSSSTKLYLRGMYNRFSDDETRRRIVYKLDDPITEDYFLYGGIDRDVKDRIKIQSLSTVNLGGTTDLGFLELDYEAAYALARNDQPNRLEAEFDNIGQAIHMKLIDIDSDQPRIFFPDSANSVFAEDYATYEFNGMRMLKELVKDENLTAKFNLRIPFYFLNSEGYFKTGAKVRFKNKFRDQDAIVYSQFYDDEVPGHTGSSPPLTLLELYDGFSETNLLDANYRIDHVPNPDKLRDFHEFYPQHFYIHKSDTREDTYVVDYTATENIYAAYGMFRYDFGKAMVIGGVRYERTDVDYQGTNILKDRRGNFSAKIDSLSKKTYAFLLPQFQFKYSLINNLNLRFAVTRSFTRPNFEDILPYKEEEEEDEVRFGNGELKFPQALNFDLLAEYYPRGGGIFSGGLFYKQIDNFIYIYQARGKENVDPTNRIEFPTKIFTIPLNGHDAVVYGAEIQAQDKLSFLPGFLRNFGIFITYTYSYSRASINKRFPANDHTHDFVFNKNYLDELASVLENETIVLPGQAPHVYNLALFYETPSFYAKITLHNQENYIHTLGVDSDLDEYYAQSMHLDFNASYRINNNFQVFVDAMNLTNEPLKYYIGSLGRILQQEYYSWWGRVGVRMSF